MSRNVSGLSDEQELHKLFKAHGWALTNRQIQESKITLNHTGRISNLRGLGFYISCEIYRDRPMDNVYRIENPQHCPEKWDQDVPVIVDKGQREWLIGINQ